jgi:hypothetical protein
MDRGDHCSPSQPSCFCTETTGFPYHLGEETPQLMGERHHEPLRAGHPTRTCRYAFEARFVVADFDTRFVVADFLGRFVVAALSFGTGRASAVTRISSLSLS